MSHKILLPTHALQASAQQPTGTAFIPSIGTGDTPTWHILTDRAKSCAIQCFAAYLETVAVRDHQLDNKRIMYRMLDICCPLFVREFADSSTKGAIVGILLYSRDHLLSERTFSIAAYNVLLKVT